VNAPDSKLREAIPAPTIDPATLYRTLYLPRAAEEKMLRLIRQGRLSKWFSGYGQEAIAVGTVLALEDQDYVLPMHRNLGVWTTRGVELRPLFCQLMGRSGGFTRGRDRTFHFGLPERRIVGMISHLGAMLPVACGLGAAAQLKGESFVAAAFIGEGATREGDFHEAMNLAAAWKLPVVFIVENNGYGLSTPTQEVMAIEHIADCVGGYGMPGRIVDGNDINEVMEHVHQAADRARAGEGPTLLEMKTFRMRGHEEASGTKYVPVHLFETWRPRDPIEQCRERMIQSGAVSAEKLEEIQEECRYDIEDAAEYALAQPMETSDAERELGDVFALGSSGRATSSTVPSGTTKVRRFIDAVSDGLRQAMEEDDSVMIMGQDIAEYGGVFKVTEGFVEQFGRSRVRNTPIIESGILGAGLGLALEGQKPVIEIQYADFITCGFNQIVNNLATTHYRWGAPVGVTIRAPFGGNIGAGPFHSQSMEAWFCHVPGLKVVIPSTPADAKGLLLASIDDPNPVLFFEHKYLYRSIRGEVDDAAVRVPLGKARVAREGIDVTIVTYGLGVHWALESAERLGESGTSVEVVDVRTLVPLDMETIAESVRRTGRVLVLHEAPLTSGFGAEITARITEEVFDDLDAPPVRVGGADMPIPFSGTLESEIYSARSRLDEALTKLRAY
jgi:2-oxoisovalerate dehydrogenase E1 component